MGKKKIEKTLSLEREVERNYKNGISFYFPKMGVEHPLHKDDYFDHPEWCDGFVDTTTKNGNFLRLITEFKFQENLQNRATRAKILAQVIFYLKRFGEKGYPLPNVCMVGDSNECFVIPTTILMPYLKENIDWSIAPSLAYTQIDFVTKIKEDNNINPHVIDVNKFPDDIEPAIRNIISIADNTPFEINLTEENIALSFENFTKNVIKDASKIRPNDLVEIFIGVITDKSRYYPHPNVPNILVTPNNREVAINGKTFESFFSYFRKDYSPEEKDKFKAISDRLVEDSIRRRNGEFYTPTLFVREAHRMLSKQFGEHWRDNYVIWDNCCGTKNLTRYYSFKELYCSTLENAELEISSKYNKEATSFQFDFLNDSLDKIPNGLKSALENNKPIIFFINPPYATATNRNETSKEGVAKTMINEKMLADKIGACSQNLYAQFLYRITEIKKQYNLTNVHIGLFSPTLFLTGSSWKGFRTYFFNEFAFADGVQFKASHFADVADNWGISFSIWNNGICENKNEFKYNLIEDIDGEINITDTKFVYNIDGKKSVSDWAKESIKKLKTFDVPNLSSGICVRDKENNRGKNFEGSFGFINNGGNNIDQNAQMVALFSTAYGNGNGHGINESNFTKCTALFSARKLIEKTWVNSKDEYLAPDETNTAYKEFENDSIIYSLFHSASNQSSLRDIDYKGRKWDIKNEFFFMGKDEIETLANENGNDECYADARTSTDRYVYTILNGIELSAEAKAVLDKARELTIKSFPYRSLFNEEHPEYQINNWDCGWYQIKALVKEYMPEDYKKFDELYKALGDKMRPMVYELGFLK